MPTVDFILENSKNCFNAVIEIQKQCYTDHTYGIKGDICAHCYFQSVWELTSHLKKVVGVGWRPPVRFVRTLMCYIYDTLCQKVESCAKDAFFRRV